MAQKGIQVVIAILPPDKPGTSIRMVYDPDIAPGLLAFELGQAIGKAVKKINPKAKGESPVDPAAQSA